MMRSKNIWEERSLDKFLWVGIGGAVGAVLRYAVSGYVQGQVKESGFPYGTLVVNVIGCLLIGVVSQVVAASDHLPSEVTLFVLVGMLGAFTTFSTLSKEAVDLLQNGRVPTRSTRRHGRARGVGVVCCRRGIRVGASPATVAYLERTLSRC